MCFWKNPYFFFFKSTGLSTKLLLFVIKTTHQIRRTSEEMGLSHPHPLPWQVKALASHTFPRSFKDALCQMSAEKLDPIK